MNGTDSINSPIVGATLSTKCSFKDDEKSTASNCDSEGYSFQWFSANELNGIYTKIDNASNSTYTIPSDQQNLYFKVELTPLTINDSKTPPVVVKNPNLFGIIPVAAYATQSMKSIAKIK